MIHRKLPLPDYYHTPIPGTCRWCNKPVTKILKNGKISKATWHPECVKKYKFYYHSSYTKRVVWKRDKGKCANCSHQCLKKGTDGWDLDHIVPLHLANGDPMAWELNNLQTLCKPCHKKKTAAEATARSIARKAK